MSFPIANNPSTSLTSLPSVFERYRSQIDITLRSALDDNNSPAYQILKYALGWVDKSGSRIQTQQGKRLRPTLCLLACEATGGTPGQALPAAAALEFIHDFSLIHDEIQDRDETRHHRPTIWTIWGDAKALVAGNILRLVADIAIWDLPDTKNTRNPNLNLAIRLTEAYLEMIEGQYLDLYYEGRHDIAVENYMEMISRKTGALIRCSLVAGALIGTQKPEILQAFDVSGRAFGMVFQIRDDYLGIWGQESATGKPVGADIRRKKNAFPFVYAMSKASKKDKNDLLSIYEMPEVGETDVKTALALIEKQGAKEESQDLAKYYTDKALMALTDIKLKPRAKRDIEELAHFLLVRDR